MNSVYGMGLIGSPQLLSSGSDGESRWLQFPEPMGAGEQIVFTPSLGYTLGVEIEFQIIDRQSFALVPLGPELQELAPDLLKPRISQELIKSILEIQTGICRDLRDVENDLLQTCTLAEELAADNGCLLYAASLHPFAKTRDQARSNDARYQAILEELQIVARRFISQGLHVHVGVPDGEAVIRVCNTIQAFLPIFLSLSTSSPYFQGEDTGLMSYRTKLFEALPLAGVYEYMEDWDHFTGEVDALIGHGIIKSVRDLWWDSRPNPRFGTIEVRICDLPSRFGDILALTSLIQAVVVWILETGINCSRLNPYLIKANKWQALRHGMNGRYVDPTQLLCQRPIDYSGALNELLNRVAGFSRSLNSGSYLSEIENICERGTGAQIQRTIYQQTGDFKEVVQQSQQNFWK